MSAKKSNEYLDNIIRYSLNILIYHLNQTSKQNYITSYATEFNVEDKADNQEAGLEDLVDHFDHFIKTIQNSISINQLLLGANLIENNINFYHGKHIEGDEFKVPPDTNFHQWVEEFGKLISASYLKCHIEENKHDLILRPNQKETKKCDCKSQIIITKIHTPNGQHITIKYTSYTNHFPSSVEDIGNLRLSKKVHNWIADHIHNGLNIKGINQLFQKRACKGVTLAHLLSSLKNFELVHHWLYSLRKQISDWQGSVTFLVDCDSAQIKALYVAFSESKILLSCKDKAKIIEHKLNQNEKRLLGEELFADLKNLMHIDNTNLNDYDKHAINKTIWIKAYQNKIPHSNMNTTNMIESWYKRLKYDNFEGKFNRHNVRARQIMPAEQKIRRRQLKAQELINTVLEFRNNSHIWTMASELTQDIRYSVKKKIEHCQLERQFYCTCLDFQMHQLL
ncbi:8888_t:CDS:2, partial [Cetraspora pellucida]